MAKLYPGIDADMAAWIAAQPMFFVASAPLSADGHVNCSPRGLDTLRVLGPNEVAWLDLTGSGNETAAHLAENGRITFMFCAFSGRPRILRLFGRGEVLLPGSEGFRRLRPYFPADLPGVRQLVRVDVTRVQTSCGFGVPLLRFEGERADLLAWAERKGEDVLAGYRAERNARSIDGLPAPGHEAD
ncbi:MAG: pyridoxamine 5'-phosphate oxidase family protein [Thiohalomonadaceae bacterium]